MSEYRVLDSGMLRKLIGKSVDDSDFKLEIVSKWKNLVSTKFMEFDRRGILKYSCENYFLVKAPVDVWTKYNM